MNDANDTATDAAAKPKAATPHSPAPWTLTRTPHRIEIRTGPHNSYAFTLDDEVNAALIVRAVNVHDALVNNLTKQRDTMGDLSWSLKRMGHYALAEACDIAHDSANAALRMARGEA